jgi:hypothetical protein
MFHPEQMTRAATQEHMPIITFMPFIPLVWWRFARVLDERTWRNIALCAIVTVFGVWADVKQLVVQGVFLAGYLVYWCWRHRAEAKLALATCVKLGAASALLGAFIVIPGLTEQPFIKLFLGDPLVAWQKTYSLHSPLALVDRAGTLSAGTVAGVQYAAQTGALRLSSQQEADDLRALLGGLQMDSPEKYAGLVVLALIVAAALFNRQRQDTGLFWFSIGMLMLAVMLGSGLSNVWTGINDFLLRLLGLPGVPGSVHLAVLLLLGAVVAGLVLLARRKIRAPWHWWLVGGSLFVFLFVPGFKLLAVLPYFKEIRAPGVFYALPFAFFSALLAGFFVTDCLAGKWRDRSMVIVATLGGFMLLDIWPYQKPMKDNGVPGRTLQNVRADYESLRTDPDMVKTYSLSGRYFHLLGPMYSGKPQVYEAFYNWMVPLGTGLINQNAFASWDIHRSFLNLMGARYVVFDKSDPNNQNPGSQQMLAAYRKTFPVASENDDIAIFRNDTARPYVAAYERACQYTGELRQSPQLALGLASLDWPLVHDVEGNFERTYRPGLPAAPPTAPAPRVSLADLQVKRETHGRVRISTTAPRDCWVVVNESYYPFWTATVDGNPVELLRVSTALMGVKLPAGKHEIVLRYRQPGQYLAAGIVSGLALLAALYLVWRHQRD